MGGETEVIDAGLPNGVTVGVEVIKERGAGDVGALDRFDLNQVQGVLEGLSQVVARALAKTRPNRATAELGPSLKVESGTLTGVLVQPGGSASLKIGLTWERAINGDRGGAPAESADGGTTAKPAGAGEPADGRRTELLGRPPPGPVPALPGPGSGRR